MYFGVLVIRDWIQEPQNMLAGLRIEAIEEDGVSRAVLALQLQLGIIDNNVAVASDAKFLAYLQNDLRTCAWCRHESSSREAFML